MSPLPDRIARLEEKAEHQGEQMDDMVVSFKELVDEVYKIRVRLEKGISFVGGISFAFSMFGAACGAAVMFALRKIGLAL